MADTTKVISIGALNVQAGSGYVATLQMSYLQPEGSITRVARDGDTAIVTAVGLGLHTYLLLVYVEDDAADAVDARRRALLREFDVTRGPVTVVIENATGTARRRFMQFVARKTDQVEGQYGRGFAVSLEAYDDVRWQGLDLVETTWTLTESGTQSVVVDGDVEVYPTYTVTPRSAKASPMWLYRRLILVEWRSPLGGAHPVDVTGGGLDTAALLSAGKVGGGANVAVMLNGQFRKYFYPPDLGQPYADAFGDASTHIWTTLTFAPMVEPYLDQPVTALDETWVVYNDDGLPATGTLKVDDEIVSYSSRRAGTLFGVKRGLYGTTAAEHDPQYMTHYQYVGWLYYGPTALLADNLKDAAYRAAVRPAFLSGQGSSNQEWRYGTFADEGAPARWWYFSWQHGLGFVVESAATGTPSETWTYPWAALGINAGWTGSTSYYARFAVPLWQVQITGRHQARLSAASYPSWPKLWAHTENKEYQEVIWSAADGVDRTLNTTFDVTSGTLWPDGGLSGYNQLSWAVQQGNYVQADIQTMRVVFDSASTPVVTLGAEDTDYDLDLTMLNSTTGESLRVQFPNATPDTSLVIDSKYQTVVYGPDGSNQYAAVQRNATRPKFLRLVPGENTFILTEDGMGTLEIVVAYRPRWYA